MSLYSLYPVSYTHLDVYKRQALDSIQDGVVRVSESVTTRHLYENRKLQRLPGKMQTGFSLAAVWHEDYQWRIYNFALGDQRSGRLHTKEKQVKINHITIFKAAEKYVITS